MKKLIALLLALMMTFSLTACSSGPELLGTYEGTFDITELVSTEFDTGAGLNDPSISLANYIDQFELKVIFEFKEDGTYVEKLDTASMEAFTESLKTATVLYMDDVMLKSFIEEFSSYGYDVQTKEDVEALINTSWDSIFISVMGISSEEFISQAIDSFASELLAEETIAEGKYKAEDGKLHSSASLDEDYPEDAYETYVIDGDTVTITGGVNVEENELLSYPIVLKKVS